MRRSSRRRFLAGLSGVSLVAGCLSGDETGDDGTPPDRQAPGTEFPDRGSEANGSNGGTNGDDADRDWADDPGPGGDPPTHLAATSRAVVRIRRPGTDHEVDGRQERGGVLIDDEHVVTSGHGLKAGAAVEVGNSDGSWSNGTTLARDPHTGIAVVALTAVPTGGTTLGFAEGAPSVGQWVILFPDPADPVRSASRRRVGAVNRTVWGEAGLPIPNCLRTDPAIETELDGGPIVTHGGTIQGIVCAGPTDDGFGVSAALARRVVTALIAEGSFDFPFMGVTLADPAEANGPMIEGILPDGPADEVGLRPARAGSVKDSSTAPAGGDVVVAIDGAAIPSAADFRTHLALQTAPGETVALTVRRHGVEQEIPVTLASRPTDPIDDRVAYRDAHAYGYEPGVPPVDGFAHLWAFDTSDPPFPDLIGDATLWIGSQETVPGRPGIFADDALAFDDDGYVIHERGVAVDTGASFSMGAWIAAEPTDDYQAAFLLQNAEEGEALGIGINSGRDVSSPHTKVMSVNRTNEWGPTSFGYGDWHLHVLRFDAAAGVAELWFDGAFDYEVVVEEADRWVDSLTAGEIVMGFRPTASRDYPFAGRIAWPWIAPGLVSPDDIQALYEVAADAR